MLLILAVDWLKVLDGMKLESPESRWKALLLGIAFLGSWAVLQAIIWPRWGPTAAVLAGLALLPLFGWAARRLALLAAPKQQDQLQHQIGVPLGIIVGVAWLVGMVSWFPMAEIETAALKQPDHPTSEFTQPMHLKGVVRYATPKQVEIDGFAHWGFFGGLLVAASGMLLGRWLKKDG